MSPIRVALLGSGIFAREAYLPTLSQLQDRCELVGIYSRSLSSAESALKVASDLYLPSSSIKLYHDADSSSNLASLLARDDIQAVFIALPIQAQPGAIRLAWKAGKAVLSEKPLAKDATEGAELVREFGELYRAKKQIWRVAENWEVEPGYLHVRELLAKQVIGKLYTFYLTATLFVDNENNKWFDTPWRATPSHQGGFLLDAGVHNVALLRTIIPSTHSLSSLSSFCALNNPHIAPYDLLHATFKYSSGLLGRFTLDYGARGQDGSNILVISGEKGSVLVEDVDEAQSIQVTLKRGKFGKEETQVSKFKKVGVEEEVRRFIKACEGRVDEFGRPEGALHDVKVIEACLNSMGSLVSIS
ncbi:NAD(P)-binding protein [Meredithblackwellia eburnea MCA 4105]